MNIRFVSKTVAQNNIRLSLFEHIEGIPSKIKFQKAFPSSRSMVVSTRGEERYHSQGKNDEVLLHTVNLQSKEERLKRTNILVSFSSLLQRIFNRSLLTMGAIGFDGA